VNKNSRPANNADPFTEHLLDLVDQATNPTVPLPLARMDNNGPKSQDLEKDEAGETRDETQPEATARTTPSVPPTMEPNLLDVKYALAMSRAVDNSQPENDDEEEDEEKEKNDSQEENDKLAKEKEKGRATWVSLPNNDDNSAIRPGVVYQQHAKEETATESAETAVDTSGTTYAPTTPPLVEQASTGTFIPQEEMATITTAHLVEDDALENGSRVQAPVEAPDETLVVPARPEPKSDSKWYWGGVMALLIIVLVVTTSLLATRPGKSDSNDQDTASQPKPVEIVFAAFASTEELYDAVDEYLLALQISEVGNETNTATALAQINVSLKYGFPIGTWDVSRLTNFSRVFDPDRSAVLEPFRFLPENTSTFNEDLGDWDVSNAVTMRGMFACAVNFRGYGLENWDVGRVQDFSYMMARAQAFEADVSAWNTSSATTMEAMMYETQVFNGNVTAWDVSNVESMAYMFSTALQFQGGDLRQWNVSKVRDMSELFGLNWAFTGNISTWDTSRVTTFFNMVRIFVAVSLRGNRKLILSCCFCTVLGNHFVQ
jgi:surface protein